MAITQNNQGFALLVAVIFMSVMLSFSLTVSALAFKQVTLTSSAVESQYAFYAADAALECILYYDQNDLDFLYTNMVDRSSAPEIDCGDLVGDATIYTESDKSLVRARYRFEFNTAPSARYCADITVYKYESPLLPKNYSTYLFAQGYSTPCGVVEGIESSGARYAVRGLQAAY
ncbi:MAG: hypothetical protein WC030_00835 [Candidatus Paceibacterota bacterium]